MFSGFSNIFQKDLIEAIGDVIRYDIKEISAAPFAAEVDESTDVTNKAQISVIIYVAKSEVACEAKEVFLGFDDVSNDRQAAAIFVSCPSCFHLFMFVYFTWRTASCLVSF